MNIFKYINNATTFLSHKISHKMTMPHKLVWMDEKFMQIASLCDYLYNLMPCIGFLRLNFMQLVQGD